jgi:uncharacterized protein (TIGR02757 family)
MGAPRTSGYDHCGRASRLEGRLIPQGDKKLSKLRAGLDALRNRYDASYLATDPLEFAHRFSKAEDRELVAFIASALAFGNVTTIRKSVDRLLEKLKPYPARYVKDLEPRRVLKSLSGFKHRWTTGRDIACLLYFVRQMTDQSGSIGGFFRQGYDPERDDMEAALARFSRRALELDHGGFYRSKRLPAKAGVRYFFSSPEHGGACKRLNLFLRWVVRPDDGLDLGLWDFIPPSRLVIPLDTHIRQIGQHLGWTGRKSPGWKMAMDITRALATVDPEDPIKYDFALSRMGILENCPRHPRRHKCDLCELDWAHRTE